MKAFVALAMGAPADITAAITETLQTRGHEPLWPAPRAPPLAQAERQAFSATLDRMHEADLLVADASSADTSVGWIVAWFVARGRLAIVCCRRDARDELPALLAGNPSPWMRLIVYADVDELRRALAGIF